MNKGYKWTVNACFIGYIIQAIVNNFVPLLFLTFQSSYGIPLSRITLLITVNFVVQLTVDLVSVAFVDKIGYRASMLIAHGMSALGLAGLTVLPRVLPDVYAGLLISVVCYAVGGGLLEVLVSPVMESCPTDNKEKAMSMLHSFYCWGQVGDIGSSVGAGSHCQWYIVCQGSHRPADSGRRKRPDGSGAFWYAAVLDSDADDGLRRSQ